MADAAIALNALLNNVAVTTVGDVVGTDAGWDVIMAGDVCYEAPMTTHILPWLRRLAARGATVWIADPGRAYLPREGLTPIATRAVPTTRELEDSTERVVTLYRLEA
jgi:predicted nicotinamide N-methyase